MISTVSILRRFAAASFEIEPAPKGGGRGNVVEQQSAVLQMAAGPCGLDKILRAAQPIQRGVDLAGRTSSTGTRVPRITGLPAMTSRLISIRWCSIRSGPQQFRILPTYPGARPAITIHLIASEPLLLSAGGDGAAGHDADKMGAVVG